MVNRVLVVGSLVVILVVATMFASVSFSQSGRNRDQSDQAGTPTLTTSDVRSGGPTTAPPAPVDVSRAADIGWMRSFNSAKSSATADQVIFVDVYTDWCGWCKYMDQRVFTHSQVKAFAANNVFVKINAEDNGEGTAFARKHGVRGFPALLMFDSNGKLIGRQEGAFRNPADFVNWLEKTSSRR